MKRGAPNPFATPPRSVAWGSHVPESYTVIALTGLESRGATCSVALLLHSKRGGGHHAHGNRVGLSMREGALGGV